MGAPNPPSPRACCMLSDTVFGTENKIDPASLGHHQTAAQQKSPGALAGTGIMYTTHLGILDFGHLRDLVDLTQYVYERLLDGCPGAASRKAPGSTGTCTFATTTRIRTTHGYATLKGPIADADLLPVAQSIAYDDSIAYEIHTYWKTGAGEHNSSFSPEDLPSNYTGTWVAARAIERGWTSGRDFADEVDAVLQELCRKADGRPKTETQAIFDKYVKGRWVRGDRFVTVEHEGYLRRRNFTGAFWDPRTSEIESRFNPAGVGLGFAGSLAAQRAKYDYTFDHQGDKFTGADFASKIAAIRADAERKYGKHYDAPDERSPGKEMVEEPTPGLASNDDGFGPSAATASFTSGGFESGAEPVGLTSAAPEEEEVVAEAGAPPEEDAAVAERGGAEEEEAEVAEAEPQEEEEPVASAASDEDDNEFLVSESTPEEDEAVVAENDAADEEPVAEAEPEEEEELVAEAEPEEDELVAEAEPEDEELVAEADPEEDEGSLAENAPEEDESVASA